VETIIGFVAGYLAGSQDGKDGVARIRSSLTAIRNSGEVRRLSAEAFTFVERTVRQAAGASLSETFGTATDILARRASAIGRRPGSRAA
jgi:hypothetical protein